MRVVVGLSGGVDSAVAAWLLQRQGHTVRAVYMKNWEEDDTQGRCSAAEDLEYAEAVCARLGVGLERVNFSDRYWERVFERFLAEYAAGRTPNPDVLCNSEIKFRAFLEYALGRGAEAVATGHYARREHTARGWRLYRATDPDKDQTYFLHRLDQAQLARAVFPLASVTKAQVRAIARRLGLPNAGRPDSTGICFIGERRFDAFLERFLPARPGEIVDLDGTVLGRHRGLLFYTIGQRKGLGLGGRPDRGQAPWYVAYKDIAGNRLVVVQGHDHPALFRDRLVGADFHWIAGGPPARRFTAQARIRHRQPLQPCRVEVAGAGRVRVCFQSPQRAVAAGQYVVLYNGRECLGGGVIETDVEPSGTGWSIASKTA